MPEPRTIKKGVKKLVQAYRRFDRDWKNRRLGAYSAQAAFYIFISLLPFLALLFGIIKAVPFENAAVVSKAQTLLPALLGDMLSEAYHAAGAYSAAAVIPVTVALTLWTASKGMYALSSGLNSAYESIPPGGLVRRAASILYTLAFMVSVVLSLFLLVFGNAILNFALKIFPAIGGVNFLFRAGRTAFILALVISLFVLIHMFLPQKRQKLQSVLPGAVLSGLGWVLLSYGYSLYIDHFVSRGNSLYGSLTAAVLLLFWLEACMSATLAGGLVNAWILEKSEGSTS